MFPIPRLYTPRLCLRPFTLADAPRVEELVSDKRVAATTLSIPHPYPSGAAATWIEMQQSTAAEGKASIWAITLAGTRTPGREHDLTETGHVIGVMGITASGAPEQARGELGYWIGVPYWNKGFATEAARAVLRYTFGKQLFHRIIAQHFADNPASGRVLEKLGMTREGVLRQHFKKWDEYKDVVCYAILRGEWESRQKKVAAYRSTSPRATLTLCGNA